MLRLHAFCACLTLVAWSSVRSVSGQETPYVAPASNEAALAIQGFQLPEGMTADLFAAEPEVANIVAFSINHRGQVYVCETFRQSRGVEDNRSHMDWLENDLSLTTLEQRREMFEKFLGEKIGDYSKYEDRLRLLEDTNGDGRADSSTVFAEGFSDVLDGTGAGVLQVGDNVWYACIPHLWRLTDTDGDGVADEREQHSSGYGIRVAFRGHDMHGLVRGPDGRIYFSIGDRGYNVTTAEGRHLFRPDTGAVFRCEPDGSNLEEFAFGLRNPQELAFDDYGNLFTVDNNSDGGDQARLTYVAQHGDTGWRMYYQYLPDRGPWSRERIWYPYRTDKETAAVQPAYTIPPIVHLGDGPSGLTAYPGLGLPDRYNGHFFLADFRGTASQSGIRSFAVKPTGAGFAIDDSHEFLWQVLATDVDFGYDGRMYVSDWVDGWEGLGKGRIYTLQHGDHSGEMDEHNVAELMAAGFAQRADEELAELLAHPDRRVRMEAQFALADHAAADVLSDVLEKSNRHFARLHALWGLGQLARREAGHLDRLAGFLGDKDPEIVAQTARLLGNLSGDVPTQQLVTLLNEGTSRQQYFAALALGNASPETAAAAVLDLIKLNDDRDPLLRHAGVIALARMADRAGVDFLRQRSDLNPAQRLAVVLVLRRLEDPGLADFLDDDELPIVVEAVRAIHDLGIDAAMESVATIGMTPDLPDALLRRVLNANFRLGQLQNAELVSAVAADASFPTELRVEAANMLADWDSPSKLDRVTNEYRPLRRVNKYLAHPSSEYILTGLLAERGELQKLAVKLARVYEIDASIDALHRIVRNEKNDGDLRRQALLAMGALEAPQLENVIVDALGSEVPDLRMAGRELLVDRRSQFAVRYLTAALDEGTVRERQHAVEMLAALDDPVAVDVLGDWLDRFLAGEAPPEIQLDILRAVTKKGDVFASELEAYHASLPADDKLAPYRVALQGGDVERGREIFFGRADASCRRCHKVHGDGSDVGPDLSAVAKENPREYLLESIVDPNAKIAKGFETVVFLMSDGRVLTGLVKGETDETYQLMQPKGEIIIVAKDEIDERAKGLSGMPANLIESLSKSDVRDLVEYLSTLKTPYVPQGHE